MNYPINVIFSEQKQRAGGILAYPTCDLSHLVGWVSQGGCDMKLDYGLRKAIPSSRDNPTTACVSGNGRVRSLWDNTATSESSIQTSR